MSGTVARARRIRGGGITGDRHELHVADRTASRLVASDRRVHRAGVALGLRRLGRPRGPIALIALATARKHPDRHHYKSDREQRHELPTQCSENG